MVMPWCRLHAEFAFDPKIQSMDETFQRRFIMLLCFQCTGDLLSFTDEELSCALRITPEELQETKELFSKKGFINGDWGLKNWDKRQYKSDSSTERVRKYREVKRFRNVTVTPPDTDTDNKDILSCKPTRPQIPYKEIISYLNKKTASNYKPNTDVTKRSIKARWNEGFRLEDFKRVIDNKTEQWATDPKMVPYLRPVTLFSTKFESYLNERQAMEPEKEEV